MVHKSRLLTTTYTKDNTDLEFAGKLPVFLTELQVSSKWVYIQYRRAHISGFGRHFRCLFKTGRNNDDLRCFDGYGITDDWRGDWLAGCRTPHSHFPTQPGRCEWFGRQRRRPAPPTGPVTLATSAALLNPFTSIPISAIDGRLSVFIRFGGKLVALSRWC